MITEALIKRLHIAKLYSGEEDRRGEIHVTDLTVPCLRLVYYERKDPWPEPVENMIRRSEGRLLHSLELLGSSVLETEWGGVKGRVYEYGNGVLVRKKFVDFVPNNMAEAQKYYSHYPCSYRKYISRCYSGV